MSLRGALLQVPLVSEELISITCNFSFSHCMSNISLITFFFPLAWAEMLVFSRSAARDRIPVARRKKK